MDKYNIFSRVFWITYLTLYIALFIYIMYLASKYLIIPALEFISNNMYAKTILVLIITAILFRLISKDDDKYLV